jgi:hypothetical protein
MMADWLVEFYDTIDASVSYEYNMACSGGSARTSNIVARNNALSESYNDFFKVDDCSDDNIDNDNEAVDESFDDYNEETEDLESHKSFKDRVMAYVSLAEDE